MIEVHLASRGESNKVIEHVMAQEMLKVQKGSYGLGLAMEGEGAARWMGHGGSNEGFRCDMRMFVASGDGIVVMTNGDNGSALTREIERAAAGVYGWPDKPAVKKAAVVSAANLARLAGSYQLQDLDFRVAVKDGGLVISSPMQLEPVEFLPESDTEFFPTADGLGKMKFHFTPEGKVEAFEIFGQRARRVEPR